MPATRTWLRTTTSEREILGYEAMERAQYLVMITLQRFQ